MRLSGGTSSPNWRIIAGPIQIVGSGATINDATENAFDRAGKLLDMTEGEVRGRCTFTGGVQSADYPPWCNSTCSRRW